MNKLILSVLAIASTATGFTAMAELPSSVSGNDNRTLYTIKSVDTEHNRGMLYASTADSKVGSAGSTVGSGSYRDFSSVSISNPAENPNLQFAIISYNNHYYLFNAGTEKFCYKVGTEAVLQLSDTQYSTIDFRAESSAYLLQIGNSTDTIVSFSNNTSGFGAILVSNRGAGASNTRDGGDRVAVTKLDGVTLSDDAYFKALNILTNRIAEEHKGDVGYPSEAARQTLRTAFINDNTASNIASAITTYKQTNDVVLPVDGTAYKIKARFFDGTTRYLCHNDTARLAQTESADNADVFICKRDANGDYSLFVHNTKEFLIYCADGKRGMGSTYKGFNSVYEADGHAATVQLSHPHMNNYQTEFDVSAEMFGTLAIQAYNLSDNGTFYLTAGKGGNFHNAASDRVFCTNSGSNWLTSYYEFEEVDHPHTVAATAQHSAFNHVALYVGTYDVVLPEGVTAWYVSAVKNPAAATEADEIMTLAEANDGEVGLTRLGSVVPANFPVLLSSTSAEPTAMRPATIETLPQVSAVENKLTVNNDSSVTTGHVLDSDGNFSEGELAANGIRLKDAAAGTTYIVKDAGELTSIANVTADAETAPVQYFDLQGRRLSAPSRGICINSRGEKILIRK